MSGWLERLRERARQTGASVCFGLDPDLRKLPPAEGSPGARVGDFYLRILERMHSAGALPAVVKPNLAYYEQLGEDGLAALRRIVQACRELELPVLLDAKRGDIGTSSSAYASAVFDGWAADAVTASPYMGGDSLAPFTAYCSRGRGVYVLCRTSNPGAADLQDLPVEGRPLYERVAERIGGAWWQEGIGAVVGATAPGPLARLARLFLEAGRPVSLLLPGIGSQGGSGEEVAALLRKEGYEQALCLYSASSSIADAWRGAGAADFAGAAVEALQKLRDAVASA